MGDAGMIEFRLLLAVTTIAFIGLLIYGWLTGAFKLDEKPKVHR
jgi:hypothetical protein